MDKLVINFFKEVKERIKLITASCSMLVFKNPKITELIDTEVAG